MTRKNVGPRRAAVAAPNRMVGTPKWPGSRWSHHRGGQGRDGRNYVLKPESFVLAPLACCDGGLWGVVVGFVRLGLSAGLGCCAGVLGRRGGQVAVGGRGARPAGAAAVAAGVALVWLCAAGVLVAGGTVALKVPAIRCIAILSGADGTEFAVG